MYCDAEYGQSAPMNLAPAILLYGSERTIRLATVHRPINDPQGGPPLLDAGEPLTRDILETLVRAVSATKSPRLSYRRMFSSTRGTGERRARLFDDSAVVKTTEPGLPVPLTHRPGRSMAASPRPSGVTPQPGGRGPVSESPRPAQRLEKSREGQGEFPERQRRTCRQSPPTR